MVDTRNITCYIKPTLKGKGSIANLTLRIDNKDITALSKLTEYIVINVGLFLINIFFDKKHSIFIT